MTCFVVHISSVSTRGPNRYAPEMEGLFPQKTTGFVRVAVDRGLDRYPDGLTYALDEELADVTIGEEVMVPLGRGNTPTPGHVVEKTEESETSGPVKHVLARTKSPALPSDLIELARWISSYYLAPLGPTISSMLPAPVRRRTGSVTQRMIDLAAEPPDQTKPPTRKQLQVLEALRTLSAEARPVDRRKLIRLAELQTAGPIDRLVKSGLLEETRQTAIEAAWRKAGVHKMERPIPTEAQQRVIDDIAAEFPSGFSTHLIRGVTGAGKTEVYLRLIEQVVHANRIALVLVPEISLTPQTGARLTGRFPDHRVALLHSGLTAAQRHQQWSQVANDEVDIILGARSAVLSPLNRDRLGLIVVDEEHDHSYKQDSMPRYHGRDVAIRLGQMAPCPVVLGSATPSLESWANATEKGFFRLHDLPERAPGLTLPKVRIVDMAKDRHRPGGATWSALGPTLEQALGETLDAGGQALLLLNRRGFASYLTCRNKACDWMLTCDDCDVSMVMHRQQDLPRGGFVRCHHCLSEQRVPRSCPACGQGITAMGQGTQRIEELLTRRFPSLATGDTLRRIDSDTMRTAEDLHQVLEAFGSGEVRVLLGTQMIAKGLDYPGVRLVGVLDADTSIHLPDFRASERTFQLVAQVCGRCGRGQAPGTAIIQTYNPEMPAIECAASGRYRQFAEAELEDRRACGLPPISRMARLVVQDQNLARCEAQAQAIKEQLEASSDGQVDIRGPSDCVIGRIAQRHRKQIELLAASPGPLHAALLKARASGVLDGSQRVTLDIDPMSLM